jgi:hypothetical protein
MSVAFVSCTPDDRSANNVDPDAIFFVYNIWGEENKDEVVVMLQYLSGGSTGKAIQFSEPASVQLDGEVLNADSTVMSGAYYEAQLPLEDFVGKHSIVFTDVKGREYKEEFQFRPITLRTEIPPVVNRGNLILQLEGITPGDRIRVMITDTSFTTDDMNQVYTVDNNTITIQQQQLENIASGPVTLQLFKEEERPIENGTRKGGRLAITYGLTREFELR